MANGQRSCLDCGSHDLPTYETRARGTRIKPRCRDCGNAERRARYNPAKMRDYSLRKRYGISSDQFDAMLAAQGGCCKACGSPETDGKYWHMDHDHDCCPTSTRTCGKCVRGILCHGCNTALGNVGDNVERLKKLIDYLEGARSGELV